MSKKATTENEKGDLGQLRSLLFGEQAQQTEERLEGLEASINSLRRENRQLRHALEVEAMARLDADRDQGQQLSGTYDSALNNLSEILQKSVDEDRQKRQAQLKAMLGVLDGFQSSQDEITAKLVKHLQDEREARAAQFAQLKQQIAADNDVADGQADVMTGLLKQFMVDFAANESADAAVEVPVVANSAETEE